MRTTSSGGAGLRRARAVRGPVVGELSAALIEPRLSPASTTVPAMTITSCPTAEAEPLRGRGLRFVLVDEMMGRDEISVRELAARLASRGYRLEGRASKVISDALRWEVRRGRVVRIARGRYRYVSAPASTARRIRLFAARCRAWLDAVAHGDRPPQFPPDPRPGPYWRALHDPAWPPWADLRWLWVR